MSLQQRLPDARPRWLACAGCFFLAMLYAQMTAAASGPATRPVREPAPRQDGAAGKAASVLLVTRGNFFLERGVKAIGPQKSATLTPEQYERDVPAGYDVVIFDSYRPVKPPAAAGCLYFGVTPAGGKLKAAEEGGQAVTLAEQRAQSWKREHPILRGADFAKVYAAKALKLEPAWGWEVLLDGTGGPLAVASRDGDGR